MGRRHDALIPLTHDHHHALHELRLMRAAADADDADRMQAADAFCAFFRDHSVQHFREEEEDIFPVVVDEPGAPMDGIVRILTEHVRLHALVRKLGSQVEAGAPDPDTMRTLADLLRAHIRFEEDELFPAIEALVADELNAVQLPARER